MKQEKPILVSLRLYKKQRVIIKQLAKKFKKSRAAIVREAINYFNDEENGGL